jgi:hypothetical protein
MNYIFVYSVIYIKCDFSKLKEKIPDASFYLIGSEYCLSRLDQTNLDAFNEIHRISRSFHQIDDDEVEQIIRHYVETFGANDIRLLTNEDSAQIGCAYKFFVGTKYVVDTYLDPREFLEKVACYPKHTKMLLDQNYSNYEGKGEHIAEQLHSMGYTRIYLLTGDHALGKMSDYLTVLMKTDLDLSVVLRD